MIEGEGVFKPLQIDMNMQTDLELIHRQKKVIWHCFSTLTRDDGHGALAQRRKLGHENKQGLSASTHGIMN